MLTAENSKQNSAIATFNIIFIVIAYLLMQYTSILHAAFKDYCKLHRFTSQSSLIAICLQFLYYVR